MKTMHLCKEDYTQVKQMLSMRQVAGFYGFKEDRRHLCTCPFHKDKHPSMRIYPDNKGFYCFSCQKGGDVVTFVAALYSTDNEHACRKLIEDFSLPITTEPTTYRERREWEKRRSRQKKINQFQRDSMKILRKYWILLCEATRDTQDVHFVEAMQELSIVEYRMQCLQDNPQEYCEDRKAVKKIGEIGRRIAGWNDSAYTGTTVSR